MLRDAAVLFEEAVELALASILVVRECYSSFDIGDAPKSMERTFTIR